MPRNIGESIMVVRAFFAVDIAEKSIIEQIKKIQKELTLPNTKINFVTPENLHLTMKFLGNIDENIIPDLEEVTKKISFKNFEIELNGMGCLPSYSYINAIYMGVTKGFDHLEFISKELNGLSDRFNFKKETRPFTAHLTIGRLKKVGNKEQLVNIIKNYEKQKFGTVSINNFNLKKSELTPKGPVYTTLFEVKGT
ncbi:MAG: RNA 2',3'-cyclic phosphodiesterase [Asgard group archaeon]|nr:RNA 2',3'-cyclic phosphodiesterase [Asgard group archaeon]